MRMWVKDPITHQKSITVTFLIGAVLLFLFAFLLAVIQLFDWRLLLISMFPMGLMFGAYQQKRVKIGFTGIEISAPASRSRAKKGKND